MRNLIEYGPIVFCFVVVLAIASMISYAMYARAECQSLGYPDGDSYPNGTIYCVTLHSAINIKELRK